MGAEIIDPPAPLPGPAFRNDDPRGSLDAITHGVIPWTLEKKEDIMSNDKEYDSEVYEQVLRGIRGDNPEHKKATAAEVKKAKQVVEAQKKHLRKKYNNKNKGGDYTIDTGMFSS